MPTAPRIADVYTRDGRNIRVYTTPGRSVQFAGGHAVVVDHRDMVTMLQTEGFLVQPTPDAMSWASEWLNHVHELKADVTWPEGWSVDFKSANDHLVLGPASFPHNSLVKPTTTDPVETVDMTAHPGGWINPAALLEAPDEPTEPPLEPVQPKRRRVSRA